MEDDNKNSFYLVGLSTLILLVCLILSISHSFILFFLFSSLTILNVFLLIKIRRGLPSKIKQDIKYGKKNTNVSKRNKEFQYNTDKIIRKNASTFESIINKKENVNIKSIENLPKETYVKNYNEPIIEKKTEDFGLPTINFEIEKEDEIIREDFSKYDEDKQKDIDKTAETLYNEYIDMSKYNSDVFNENLNISENENLEKKENEKINIENFFVHDNEDSNTNIENNIVYNEYIDNLYTENTDDNDIYDKNFEYFNDFDLPTIGFEENENFFNEKISTGDIKIKEIEIPNYNIINQNEENMLYTPKFEEIDREKINMFIKLLTDYQKNFFLEFETLIIGKEKANLFINENRIISLSLLVNQINEKFKKYFPVNILEEKEDFIIIDKEYKYVIDYIEQDK
ncbi:MAG: hypothetical protein FWF57_06595 [Defluviitaleaceae bacterium]|nr:hypothetical protein [Defluviitaleaceae bacterium]